MNKSRKAIEACPEVTAWFDDKLNAGYDLGTITVASTSKYYFRCPECGEVYFRAMGKFCRKQHDGTYLPMTCQKCHPTKQKKKMRLSEAVPDIGRFWDDEANGGKRPSDFGSTSTAPVVTRCPICGEPVSRTARNSWKPDKDGIGHIIPCKRCANHRSDNNLLRLVPEILDVWNRKNIRAPETYTVRSGEKVYIDCPICGRERHRIISETVIKNDSDYRIAKCVACLREAASMKGESLADACPDILNYWADTNPKQPDEILRSSTEIVFTYCPSCNQLLERRAVNTLHREGDRWAVTVCHQCAVTRANAAKGLRQSGPVSEVCPSILDWWDDERNAYTPEQVSHGSHYEAYLRCPACKHLMCRDLHSFILSHRDGSLRPVACPVCGYNGLGDPEDNLVVICPEIVNWWDYEKNAPFRPEQFTKGAGFMAHLICPECGMKLYTGIHSLLKTLDNGTVVIRHDGKCLKLRAQVSENNLVRRYPEIVYYWDYEKNNPHRPEDFTVYSSHEAYFRCPDCGNESYYNRISDALTPGVDGIPFVLNCQYCAGLKATPGVNSLKALYPELVESEWDEDRNREYGYDPDQLLPTSWQRTWWRCGVCGYVRRMPVCERVEKYIAGEEACAVCDEKRVLPGYNSLKAKYTDLVAEEWSEAENLADGLDPDRVSERSSAVAKWHCSACDHIYTMSVRDRVRKLEEDEEACPYCTDRRVLPGFNSFKARYPKLVAEEWSESENLADGLDPDRVSERSYAVAKWHCPTCNGTYSLSVKERVLKLEQDEEACPYCTDRRVLPGFNSLKALHPKLVQREWSELTNAFIGLDPDQISVRSCTVAWWNCPVCNNPYPMSIKNRLLKDKRGHEPCPVCNGRRLKKIHYI